MADLSKLLSMVPGGGVKRYQGRVVTVDGIRKVNVGGNVLEARWADPLIVADGDSVTVDVTAGATGQASVFVLGRTTTQPRPKTGKVTAIPAGSPTITIQADDGKTYNAEFIGTYQVGDNVHLDWGAGLPRVMGKVTTTPAAPPPDPTPPPPPAPTSGSTSGTATDSGTYWGPGGWRSWAGGGYRVMQGSYGAGPVFGAWFYGTKFKALTGRTIKRVRLRTGARQAVGGYNAPAVFHFYAHTSPAMPGGDVNRVSGPHNVTIQPGQGPADITLPLSFAATVIAGGGISIAGEPYAAMNGIDQPDSGRLIFDWEK